MHRKKIVPLFTSAYGLARVDKVLRIGPARRVFIAAYFLYKGLFEDSLKHLVEQKPELFQAGDVLDVGANIGYTACVFARALSSDAKVYAFEPDQVSYGLLEEVVRRKHLSGVIEPINTAVGSSDGHINFWHNERHSADHRVVTDQFKSSCADGSQVSVVPVTTVDTFVKARDLRKISIIKIDVQGYEPAVCAGMTDTLNRFPEALVCLEYSPDALDELGFQPGKLLDLFRVRGYLPHILTRDNPKRIDDASLQHLVDKWGYVDLLYSRQTLI